MDPTPSDDDPLIDLLLEYEERVAKGEVVSAADLCPDRPGLVPALTERMARLQRVAPLVGPESLDPATGVFQPPPEPLGGRYRCDEEKGAGGFGVVYRAFDLQIQRPVAVKLPRPGLFRGNPGGEDAFLAEARRAGRLRHPGIVRVFDVGRHQGTTFIVSEFIDGDDLGRRMEGKPLPAREAARIVERAARSLHHAHQAGITHRDMKPSNILIGRDGQVLLTDFGIAASADTAGRLNGGTGTFSYMAPERLDGDPGLDPRADVYSLGVVLYELLTGRLPLAGATPAERKRESSVEPIRPQTFNPDIPPEVERLCLDCLATDPARRPQSAEDLADQLARSLADPEGWSDTGQVGWVLRTAGASGPRPDFSLTAHGETEKTRNGQQVAQEEAVKARTGEKQARNHLVAVEYGRMGWSRSRRPARLFLIAVSLMGLGLILVRIVAPPDHRDEAYHVGRATALSDRKEYDEAIMELNEAIRLNPKNAPAFILRGRAWYWKNEYDKAIGDFDEAIRLDPDSANAFVWRGRAWYRKKEYDRAIQDYDEAVRLDPNNFDAFFRRGLAWYRKKEYDQAIRDFDQAIHLQPDEGYAAIMCYFAARRTGNERVAERVLKESADSPSAPWPNPAVRFLRGQIDEAQLLMLADDDEKRTEAHSYLGLYQAIKDRKKEAIAHFRWVKDHGSSAVSAHALALEELERLEPDEK
jgi:tetratricopeptide (TPR) repeat protein/predicted Ser/Thr protein kinase